MKKAKTHEEWFVGFRQKYKEKKGEKGWTIAKAYYPGQKSIHDQYCSSEEEARKVLDYVYMKFNGVHTYNAKGERYETSEAAPGIGVSVVITKQDDDDFRIVKHIIRKRIVTEWEVVESA